MRRNPKFPFGGGPLTAATVRPRVCVVPRQFIRDADKPYLGPSWTLASLKLGRGAVLTHGVPALFEV